MKVVVVDELIGQVAKSVTNHDDWELIFEMTDDRVFKFFHEQECCESVSVEEIHGDLEDLVGQPLVQAEYVTEDATEEGADETATWTFYKFATNRGSVTVRWYGTSNGYYSESVDFGWF